jgi:hypothetical protein
MMADPSITATRSQDPAPTLFQAALGERWRQLPRSVQRLRSVQDRETSSGRARVSCGRGLLARLVACCFGLPTAADDAERSLGKARTAHGEVWQRDFAGRRFRSLLSASVRRGHCRECFGALSFEQALGRERDLRPSSWNAAGVSGCQSHPSCFPAVAPRNSR